MRGLVYRFRYALRIRARSRMSIFQAPAYPLPLADDRGDPIDDADAEIDAWSY